MEGVELEDILPEQGNEDLDVVRRTNRYWLKIGDLNVHKASAVRWLLGRKKDGRKSTDRTSPVAGLLKVRTYSREPLAPKLDDDSVIGNTFLLGEYIASFLRVDNAVALAVVRVAEILNSVHASFAAVGLNTLCTANITLRGQVLTLKQLPDKASWEWVGEYESFHATDCAAGSKKSSIIEFPACLTKPVRVKLTRHLEGSTQTFHKSFNASVLDALSDVLWDQVKGLVSRIPAKIKTATFPMHVEQSGTSRDI